MAMSSRAVRWGLWSAVAVGLVIALLVGVLATRKSAEAHLADSPLLGHPAPELRATAIDGRPVDIESLRGKWVVVNFFATWCVPCQQEHPELVRFSLRHSRAGDAQVIGVVFDDSVRRVRSYLREKGGDWPVVDDPNATVALDWGVRGPPESYLVDPQGFVRAKVISSVTSALLEDLLTRASRGER